MVRIYNGGLDDTAGNHNRRSIPLSRFCFAMLRKKDYEESLRRRIGTLRGNRDHSLKELDAIAKGMPVRVMQSNALFGGFCVDNAFSLADSASILAWVMSQKEFLEDIRVYSDVSYADACNYYKTAQTNTILIHRLNYMLHECMITVREILEKDGRFRFAVKKAYNDAERVWDGYYHRRRSMIEDSAWYTFADHLRLADAALCPYREKVYEVVRDSLIGRGAKDVEMKGRCAVFFLMAKVCGHSSRQFFEDFRKESGVDFTICFKGNDLREMAERLAGMCGLLGIGTERDENGYYRLGEFNPDGCRRFQAVWKGLMTALRDDDLMDETAQRAISYNPEVQRNYEEAIADEERKAMAKSIDLLSEKFKVRKGK